MLGADGHVVADTLAPGRVAWWHVTAGTVGVVAWWLWRNVWHPIARWGYEQIAGFDVLVGGGSGRIVVAVGRQIDMSAMPAASTASWSASRAEAITCAYSSPIFDQ